MGTKLRTLQDIDFKSKDDVVTAKYIGKSRFLLNGGMYNVTLSNTVGKVTVQKQYNEFINSNGGVQFSMNTFLVELPEENTQEEYKTVTFNDLSLEEQERIRAEVKAQLEEENLLKDAILTFKMKKKDLVNTTLSEIYDVMQVPHIYKTRVKDRFVNLSNFLYGYNNRKSNLAPPNTQIESKEDWEIFEQICKNVKKCMIESVSIKKQEDN